MKGLDLLAPKLIDKASKEVDKIAEARIRQAISKSGQKKKKKKIQKVQKITPSIIQGAIDDVCETPFRLFGDFLQVKKRLLRLLKQK